MRGSLTVPVVLVTFASLAAVGSPAEVADVIRLFALAGATTIEVASTAQAAASLEDLLVGERPSAELFDEAARRATEDLDPPADLHGSSDYRKTVAAAVVRRGLRAAADDGTTAAASRNRGQTTAPDAAPVATSPGRLPTAPRRCWRTARWRTGPMLRGDASASGCRSA